MCLKCVIKGFNKALGLFFSDKTKTVMNNFKRSGNKWKT